MKHFIDIEHYREGNAAVSGNYIGFAPGNMISVTEKIDGANASIQFIDGVLTACSRKQILDEKNSLNGFWQFVQTVDAVKASAYKDYTIFGEWLVKHTVRYREDAYSKWYVYDVYDNVNEAWMPQDFVKQVCRDIGLNYVHVLYEGPFLNWDHIFSLAKEDSAYGATEMEGVVVKNMDRLDNKCSATPSYIKFVNQSFRETKAHMHAPKDPAKEAEYLELTELMATVCTKNRVRKEILKCIDEGLLVPPFTPKDMDKFAKLLPKRIYEDLVKEENDTLLACGEKAGKLSGSLTMKYVRELILQGELAN